MCFSLVSLAHLLLCLVRPEGSRSEVITTDAPPIGAGYDVTDADADHFGMAVEFDEGGNLALAILSFRAAAKFTPSSEAWSNLGMALLDEENPDKGNPAVKEEAAECFQKALDLNSDNEEARSQLSALTGEDFVKDDDTFELLEAVRNFDFAHALQVCEQGGLDSPGASIHGSPVLNFLSQYISRHDNNLDHLFSCLIESGFEMNLVGKGVRQIAPLLSAVQARNERLTYELVQAGADLSVSYRLRNDTRSGTTALHSVLMADPTMYIKNVFLDFSNIELMASVQEKKMRALSPDVAEQIATAMESYRKQKESGRAEFMQRHMQVFMNAESCLFLAILLKSKTIPDVASASVAFVKAQRDMWGRTPLHYAAKHGNAFAATMLLDAVPGFLDAKDQSGMTALDLALSVRQGEEDDDQSVVAVLRARGAVESGSGTDSRSHSGGSCSEVAHARQDLGGWNAGGVEEEYVLKGERCDIDERYNLTASEFLHEYFARSRPVILRGLARDWKVRQAWTLENLTRAYGKMHFTTGPIPYSNHFGQPDQKRTLEAYVEAMAAGATTTDAQGNPYYVFEDPAHQTVAGGDTTRNMENLQGEPGAISLVEALKADYAWQPHFLHFARDAEGNNSAAASVGPAVEMNMFAIAQQFYLGGKGTGAPIHWHGDAWNVCAYGQRRWFLFPPPIATYSKIPMHEWVRKDYPELLKLPVARRPLECMQKAGDVIYVPHLFGHGTYNVQQSVGVAVEVAHAGQTIMPLIDMH